MYQLLDEYSLEVERLNGFVLKSLMETISDKPCGEGHSKILIFSPHPDDDVICMGGTMQKLNQTGQEVHVCY